MLFTKPSFHLVGDDLGAGGAAAVAGHDGAALDTYGAALAIHHTLQHGEALGAEALNGGLPRWRSPPVSCRGNGSAP